MTGLDAPGVGDAVARLQDQQVRPGCEAVRRAGHGLDGDCPPAARWVQGVAGEHLQPPVTLPSPERYLNARTAQPAPGPAVRTRGQPGETEIDLCAGHQARHPEVVGRSGNVLRLALREAAVVG